MCDHLSFYGKRMIRFIWLCSLLIVFALPAKAESFEQWKAQYKQRAVSVGVSASLLDRFLNVAEMNERVIELDRKQPEGQMTLQQYVERTVTDKRVQTGRDKWRANRELLASVERQSGVPASILVALWGKETDFGGFTGKSDTISSLATLAYEGRRRAFFEQELLNAILLAEKLNMAPGEMQGSWAGALGQCQFMPSNYIKYAVDGNKNGRVDLWNELPDVFASMANLLVREGWKSGAGWGQRITLPAGFDKSLIGRDKSPRDFYFWEQRGVRFPQAVPASVKGSIRLYQPDGASGPAYALYPNFDVLMRWNRSGYFATAVGRLSDHLSAVHP